MAHPYFLRPTLAVTLGPVPRNLINFFSQISCKVVGCHWSGVLFTVFSEHRRIKILYRSPTQVGTFDVNVPAHVASRISAAIFPASKNGGFYRELLGS